MFEKITYCQALLFLISGLYLFCTENLIKKKYRVTCGTDIQQTAIRTFAKRSSHYEKGIEVVELTEKNQHLSKNIIVAFVVVKYVVLLLLLLDLQNSLRSGKITQWYLVCFYSEFKSRQY